MKKVYLLIIMVTTGLITFGQPQTNNVEVGLFAPGTNGSSTGLGAYVEVALRIKPGGVGYTPLPVAENYGVYLVAPKSDFSTGDIVEIMQVNSSIYATTAIGVMIDAGVLDIGAFDPANLYFPVILNSGNGLNLSSLSPGTNSWSFSFTFKFNNPKTSAAYNKIRVVDRVNNTAFSAWAGGQVFTTIDMASVNQLTNIAISTLPVSLLNFSGYKNGSRNSLLWSTGGEQNNLGFEVQRSADGVNYTAIGFVNSLANGGNSSTDLNYTFDDNSPAISKKQYYRLNQKDIDGHSKLSNIVLINGDKPKTLGIGGLFPNPASTQVNVIIDAPQRDKVTLVVTDMTGKTVKQQLANVGIGSNTVRLDIANLAGGSYLIKLICGSSDCETAVSKFNKQ